MSVKGLPPQPGRLRECSGTFRGRRCGFGGRSGPAERGPRAFPGCFWKLPGCPGATERHPGTTERCPGVTERHPGATERCPGAAERHSGTTERHSGAAEKPLGATEKHSGATERHPGAAERCPGDTERHPGTAERCPGKLSRPARPPRERPPAAPFPGRGVDCINRAEIRGPPSPQAHRRGEGGITKGDLHRDLVSLAPSDRPAATPYHDKNSLAVSAVRMPLALKRR